MKTDLTRLARIVTLFAREGMVDHAKEVHRAIEEITQLRVALQPSIPELNGTSALVLFFPSEAARAEFTAAVRRECPNLQPRDL